MARHPRRRRAHRRRPGAVAHPRRRRDSPGGGDDRAEEASSPEPTPSASEDAPQSGPSDDPAEVVEETLDQYYELLPDDPDAAYDLTGPYLRSQATRGYFRDFWEPWSEVELQDVRGVQQSGDGVITATTEVQFTRDDGDEQTERHQVRLLRGDDGNWLVDLDLVA